MLPEIAESAFLVISRACSDCQGQGRVSLQQPGTMPTSSQCMSCQGTGIVSTPMNLNEFAKVLLPLLFPPVETPPASEPPTALLTDTSPTVVIEALPSSEAPA